MKNTSQEPNIGNSKIPARDILTSPSGEVVLDVVYPDVGYSPRNFRALVSSTALSNVAFFNVFNIKEQTFYSYLSGSTMPFKKWDKLRKEVIKYNKLYEQQRINKD